MKFKVKIKSEKAASDIKKYEKRLNNLSIPFVNYARWFVKETDKQFDTEIDSDGVPWTKLKRETLARKRRMGYPDSILTETGETRRSLSYKASKQGAEVWIEGTAIFHQECVPQRNLPQRKIIGMNPKREEKLQETFDKWLGIKNPSSGG